MSVYKIDKPHIYNDKWYIFPNTTLTNIDMADCNDTIDGICKHTDTIEECIQLCENDVNKRCKSGYFLETPDNKNICVPLTSYPIGKAYPYYRWRHKDFYPEFKNIKSTSFILTSIPYPSNVANSIFYHDSMKMRNVETGLYINKDSKGNAIFTKQNNFPVKFLPLEITRSLLEKYIQVKNGDNIVINIPQTAYVLRQEGVWLLNETVVKNPSNTFMIHAIDNNVIGRDLNYTEKFYFMAGDRFLNYNQELNQLELVPTRLKSSIFEFIPQVEVYYCDGSECKSMELADANVDGSSASYKGQIVERNPACFGMCSEKKKRSYWFLWLFLILCVGIVMVILRYF